MGIPQDPRLKVKHEHMQALNASKHYIYQVLSHICSHGHPAGVTPSGASMNIIKHLMYHTNIHAAHDTMQSISQCILNGTRIQWHQNTKIPLPQKVNAYMHKQSSIHISMNQTNSRTARKTHVLHRVIHSCSYSSKCARLPTLPSHVTSTQYHRSPISRCTVSLSTFG